MRRLLDSIGRRVLSGGEFSAFQDLLSEFVISRHHRSGLRQIRKSSWSRPAKINLGSGTVKKPGFLNVDLFPGGDLTLDLRRGLPFESNSCEMIFSEHFFEHIEYPEPTYGLLRECLRVLKAGATLRFSVPDTEWPLRDYVAGCDSQYFRACKDSSWYHPAYCTTRLEHINHHFRQIHEHRFAYDEETAKKVLGTAGFCDVHRVPFDPALDSHHREVGSLFMLARKPA